MILLDRDVGHVYDHSFSQFCFVDAGMAVTPREYATTHNGTASGHRHFMGTRFRRVHGLRPIEVYKRP